jgi:hypothetical protein
MPVFAVLAAIAFAVALVLRLVGHGTADAGADLVDAGFLLIALHLATGWSWATWGPGAHRATPPQ